MGRKGKTRHQCPSVSNQREATSPIVESDSAGTSSSVDNWKLMRNQILGLEKQMTTLTAKNEAALARLEKNNANNENLLQECSEKMLTMLADFINKDMQEILKKVVTKEMASVSPNVTRSLSPVIHKACQPFLEKAVQKEIASIPLTAVESLSLTMDDSISSLFQDSLKSCLDASLTPAFEKYSKDMVEQMVASIEKGMIEFTSAAQTQYESNRSSLLPTLNEAMEASMIPAVVKSMHASFREAIVEHTSAVLRQFESNHSYLSHTLKDIINSASESAVKLSRGLDMGGKQVFSSKNLNELILDRNFDKAFSLALDTGDFALVSSLCSQVDLQAILTLIPLPLSQNVLLSLLRMLSSDIQKDTSHKLCWMLAVTSTIIVDQTNASNICSVFTDVELCLESLLSTCQSVPDISSIRAVLLMIRSVRKRWEGK